jgi:hypothetical protein
LRNITSEECTTDYLGRKLKHLATLSYKAIQQKVQNDCKGGYNHVSNSPMYAFHGSTIIYWVEQGALPIGMLMMVKDEA